LSELESLKGCPVNFVKFFELLTIFLSKTIFGLTGRGVSKKVFFFTISPPSYNNIGSNHEIVKEDYLVIFQAVIAQTSTNAGEMTPQPFRTITRCWYCSLFHAGRKNSCPNSGRISGAAIDTNRR
jgi:hypothetical protein